MSRRLLPTAVLQRLANDRPIAPACEDEATTAWTLPAGVDDRTTDYIVSVREGFERLGDAVRQLAALLILNASGLSVPPDHPALSQARRDTDEARSILGSSRPTQRAAHYASHLDRCVEQLDLVFACFTGRSVGEARRALARLGRASDHLRWAAGALPGFALVALAQGCACCGLRFETGSR